MESPHKTWKPNINGKDKRKERIHASTAKLDKYIPKTNNGFLKMTVFFFLNRFRTKFNSKRLKMLKGMMIRAKEKYLFSNLRLK